MAFTMGTWYGTSGASPAPAPTPTPTPAANPVEQSAKAQIQATLNQFGLGNLAPTVWEWYLAGKPLDQIMLDMRQTDQYKARFPGMDALSKKGMSISEAEYISYERTVGGLFRAYGLPAGFYDDPKDFANFISNNVSVSEVEERLKLASTAVYQAPPETRAELQRLYGIGTGALTAFWLDPQKAFPLLQQQYAAAQIGGASQVAGYGALTRTEAETLAGRGLNPDQMYKGFGTLTETKELQHALPGEQGYTGLNKEQAFGAVFGYDPGSQLKLEQEAAKRKAAFSGGGQYAATDKGVIGLGSEK